MGPLVLLVGPLLPCTPIDLLTMGYDQKHSLVPTHDLLYHLHSLIISSWRQEEEYVKLYLYMT